MKWFGLVLAIVIIAIGAWFDWTYHSIRTEVTDLGSRLPSQEALDRLPPEQTAETLKLADIDCQRVDKSRQARSRGWSGARRSRSSLSNAS
jgi:hypothetical protein